MTEQTGAPSRPLGDADFFAPGSQPGGSATPGAAAGFRLSREAMTAELGNLQKLRTRIDAQLDAAVPMWSIISPGQDPASLRNAAASNKSGDFYRGHLVRESTYLSTVINKMRAALGIHETTDQQAGTAVNQAGQGPI
ncbi:PE domain-containing protein [Amycolatopsis sp. NBC_01480]|uniref:PE domain-containing protein n=1 Tax=Amycolatopsis sp. NBC_01480 TaxID=2903562 RepID=UPI002E2BF341|nr:PE domain-containing protein [Amycolatopsis sp. NBC_01480]